MSIIQHIKGFLGACSDFYQGKPAIEATAPYSGDIITFSRKPKGANGSRMIKAANLHLALMNSETVLDAREAALNLLVFKQECKVSWVTLGLPHYTGVVIRDILSRKSMISE